MEQHQYKENCNEQINNQNQETCSATTTSNQRKTLTILSILGLICTIKLAIIYFQSNYNPYSTPSFCAINDFVDCDSVATTTKSVFLGIPLAYWGMFLYSFILMLLNVENLSCKKGLGLLKVFKNPISYISALGIISVILSVWLAITSFFIIHKLCLLCFVTYFINFRIMIVATKEGFKKSLKESFVDFIDGVKNYTLPFIVAIILAGLFLSYTTFAMPFASRRLSIKHFMTMKTNPYKAKGNLLGNKNGKIRLDVYTDFVCPHCFFYNIMMHKLVKDNKNIYVVHHNFPLDTECNPYIDEQMHKGACRMAKYGIAGENQGKYWEMASALFETQPKDDNEAIKLAKSLNLDINKFKTDIHSEMTAKRLRTEIDSAIANEIDGTPTFVVYGEHYTGVKPYYEFKRIVEGK